MVELKEREIRSISVEPGEPVWIEVDLSAIRQNFQAIRRFVDPKIKILAVVKANAYGHGLFQVARALGEAGADFLGVATVAEGVALRRGGTQSRILVLGQLLPEEASAVVEHRLIQSAGDEQALLALSRAAVSLGSKACVHLKVDTGMGRYGVWHEEALSLARGFLRLPGLEVEGMLTHLSMAGQNAEETEKQLERFARLIDRLKEAGFTFGLRHAANSVGLVKFPDSHWDLVRTGLLVYGASPIKEGRLPFSLKAALRLISRVRFLKNLPQGQTVSYGGTHKLTRATRVATIPVGYAHGFSRALSNRAEVLIRRRRAKVIGRITMEDLMCDVTDIPGVEIGDEVVLLGAQGNQRITAEELAAHARTIPYEILAGLSAATPRLYR